MLYSLLPRDPILLMRSKHMLQAMGDVEKAAFMKSEKTLEINPYHPLIQELKKLVCGFGLSNRPCLT